VWGGLTVVKRACMFPCCSLQAILSAQTFPNAAVDAVDVSEPALQVAARNVSDYGLEDRVALRHSDMFAALKSPKVRLCGARHTSPLSLGRLSGVLCRTGLLI
jgi:hypothetical protein